MRDRAETPCGVSMQDGNLRTDDGKPKHSTEDTNMEKIKAKFVDLGGKKFTKTFSENDFGGAHTAMVQFLEDRKDVILMDWWEA